MEKTNQEIYDKLLEGFNRLLQENAHLRNKLEEYDDHIQSFYSLTFTFKKEVEELQSQIKRLNQQLNQ